MPPSPRIFIALLPAALPFALAACGVRNDLKPALARQLPVQPYGRPDRATSHELLTPGSVARPGNSVELRIKSEPRSDDPFDLPPKD